MERVITYDPLWKKLIDLKMSRGELRDKADLSKGTLAKLGKNEDVNLSTVCKICNALDCGIEDVVACDPAGN